MDLSLYKKVSIVGTRPFYFQPIPRYLQSGIIKAKITDKDNIVQEIT